MKLVPFGTWTRRDFSQWYDVGVFFCVSGLDFSFLSNCASFNHGEKYPVGFFFRTERNFFMIPQENENYDSKRSIDFAHVFEQSESFACTRGKVLTQLYSAGFEGKRESSFVQTNCLFSSHGEVVFEFCYIQIN